MAAIEGPFRLAVADYEDPGIWHCDLEVEPWMLKYEANSQYSDERQGQRPVGHKLNGLTRVFIKKK